MLSRIKLYEETGEEHTNCSKDIAYFVSFLVALMRDFLLASESL